MVFDVKQDGRRKSRLIAGGHLIDVVDHNLYSSTVKGLSVRLLHVIAHKQKLEQLQGDIGNAYVNAYTKEKVYTKAGQTFGVRKGGILIIRKALYGLITSSERFVSHLSDTLGAMGFRPTRYDRDVWIRKYKDKNSYEYVCTHSDDFLITSKEPEAVLKALKAVYTIKSSGKLDYYLESDHKYDKKGRVCIGCKTYIKEAIERVENWFGK